MKITEDTLSRISKLSPNKQFFRILFLIALTILLLSQFSWTKPIFSKILNFPELRHVTINSDIISDNLHETHLYILNDGYGKADNVLIHIFVPEDGIIQDYLINSQELYDIQHNYKDNVLDIWMERLAPGASVYLKITGQNFPPDELYVSVVSDQGVSTSTDDPSFSSQIYIYRAGLTEVFHDSAEAIASTESFRSGNQLWTLVSGYLADDSVRGVILLLALIYVFIILFLPTSFLFIIPIINAILVIIFIDVEIPFILITIPITIVIIAVIKVIWQGINNWLYLLISAIIFMVSLFLTGKTFIQGDWLIAIIVFGVSLVFVSLIPKDSKSEIYLENKLIQLSKDVDFLERQVGLLQTQQQNLSSRVDQN